MADEKARMTDADFDGLLARLSEAEMTLPDGLVDRVLADAESHRPMPGARVRPSGSFLSVFSGLLGGWKGAGGLVATAVVGFWIGVSPPAAIETATADIWDLVSPDLTLGWAGPDDIL